jgi:hypothetical protein
MIMILVAGFLAISIFHLLLTIATSHSVYELADLKREKRDLDITSQILAEQVASLASQQNLLNAANKLGMVSNSNPAFLRLADQTLLGNPEPTGGSSGQSSNLVANSSMISVVITRKSVAPASTVQPQIIPVAGGSLSVIPASPTR